MSRRSIYDVSGRHLTVSCSCGWATNPARATLLHDKDCAVMVASRCTQKVIDEGARVQADHQKVIDDLRALLARTAAFVDVDILKHNKIGEDIRIALTGKA